MTKSSINKVLIVDPDPEIPPKIAGWLKGESVQVIAALDGESGFMRYRREMPEAVIASAQLDKVVGSALCQRIKNHPNGVDTMVLLASEKYGEHPELGDRAVSMFGADGYLVKPYERDSVVESLRPLLAGVAKSKNEEKADAQNTAAAPPGAEKSARHKSIEGLPLPPESGENDTSEFTATLRGSLSSTPLPTLISRLADLNRTGKVTIERNRIRREIYFRDGLIAHVTSTLRNENPALMLVEDEIITEEEYSRSLMMMSAEGKSVNEALVAASSLSYEALYTHSQEYEYKILIACFAWSEGHFIFHPMDKLPENIPSLDFKPLGAVFEGVRRHYTLKRLAAPVHENMDRYAARTQRFAELVDQLELDTKQLKFVLLIDGKRKTRELVTMRREDLTDTYQILWMLNQARMVEFYDKPRSVASSEFLGATEDKKSRKKPIPRELFSGVMREYYRIKSSNYFKVLDVDIKSETGEIENAYENIERKYHPDNMQEYNLQPIMGKLTEILEKAQAARRVLLDERTRREYRHYLEVQERQLARDETLQAEITFKEGERAMLESDFATAKKRFEQATKLKPDEPEYYAYLGWTVFQVARESKNSADVKKAKQYLNKAVVMNPDSDKAYLILGRLYAGEGNLELARQHFEKAVGANPECVPAQKALEILNKAKPEKTI